MISINEHISDNTVGDTYSCNRCNDKAADIFEVEGDYCLDSWLKLTLPNPLSNILLLFPSRVK
jgi:hypothetical protein